MVSSVSVMGLVGAAKIGFARSMREAAPGDIGQDVDAGPVVEAGPGGNFVEAAEAALAQAAACIHLADIGTG